MNFTEQSREEVVKSVVNWSISKQMWTFPKRKRFWQKKPECPMLAYNQNLSALTHKPISFATSTRNLFNDTRKIPSASEYHPTEESAKNVPLFGESREKCTFNSYIPIQLAFNPGPNKYEQQQHSNSKKGFTMRPKTAQHRNYFIEDRQKEQVPGPCHYDPTTEKKGDCSNSKFRSVTLGAGLMQRTERFQECSTKTPSPFVYSPNKVSLRSGSIGGKMGTQLRQSFIDDTKKQKKGPGPGNYQLPSQFGHYKQLTQRRVTTLDH